MTAIALALLSALVIGPTAAWGLDVLPLDARREIAAGVRAGAGTVAWSPDGQRLAFIGDRLYIEEMDTEQRTPSPVREAYFVAWIDESSLLALSMKGGKVPHALRLDAEGRVLEEAPLPSAPDAAYPLEGFRRLLLVSDSMEEMSIGVRTISALHVHETGTGENREAYNTDRIHPRSLKGKGFIMGWSGAGPSPLDEAMLLISYKDPPALNPYSQALVVDYLTGSVRDIYRSPINRLMPGAAWSPKGDRIAVPGDDGLLRLMGRDGVTMTLDDEVRGTYAAWSSSGARLCFGAQLLYTDGTARRSLTGSDRESRCYWRPRGREVAVLSGGVLRLYRDPLERGLPAGEAEAGQRAREKVRVLRDLYRDRLIDAAEYDKRFRNMMGYRD